jgi:hypothetical protein
MRSLERSATFWLRAYPPAWRDEKADEVTAVLLDLAPPAAGRLDARTALGLLRGGVATRWRQTPPLRVYLPYRMLDVRVPAQYRDWVRQDIAGPGYFRRNLSWRLWMFVLPVYMGLTGDLERGDLVGWALLAVAAAASGLSVRPQTARRRRLQSHARPGPGEARAVGAFVWVRRPRERIAARPGAGVLVLLLGVGAAAWSVAALVAPTALRAAPCEGSCIDLVIVARGSSSGMTAALLAAVLAGLALALAVDRRCGRLLARRPDQPARRLVGLPPHARAALVVWTGVICGAATAEATGTWVLSLSAVAGPACLLLLPPALVVRRHARTTDDVALVDLWHVARTGRPVVADRLDSELVPALAEEVR